MEQYYPSQQYMYDQYGNVYPNNGQFLPLSQRGYPGTGQGGGPSSPPPFGPPDFGQGPQGMPPTGPPPAQIPQQAQQLGDGPQLYAVDPGSMRGCLYRFTYVWLSRYNSFWFYPTYIGRRSVAGYRWTGFNWVYFGIDTERIQSFSCV
ncbi:hypothetical protein GI584_17665 [Gracilibacillus salitolerans]|uniref:Transporter n=1 Tax=Gracilibacillus salitolerans TaxID=2663022 RepID=A0A5Q2TL99_9BACI|nr:hypothetical protein [Gracilibacillus salitolerans]QGH35764.1 hypothetical protein GI584_17665 [Gracilibacillus salitolerans]